MTKPFVVVVGTDYSQQAERAMLAAYESALRSAPAELHVVHACFGGTSTSGVSSGPTYEGLGRLPVPSGEEQHERLAKHLDAVFSALPGFHDGKLKVFVHVIANDPVLGLTSLACTLHAQLLVVGSHGHQGVTRWLLGSVAEGAVRNATCPVLVIPPEQSDASVPAVEPPCPRCIAERVATKGSETWCEQHRVRHGRRHTYHQGSPIGNDHSLPLLVR